MADHVKSLTERVNVFGLAPSTKWNEFLWGVGFWGEGSTGIPESITKHVSESIISDSVRTETGKSIGDALTVLMAMTDTKLTDGSGYSYVFPGGVTDAEEQVMTDFTRESSVSTTWTKQSAGNTSWS